ncbi:MAG TPA: hypothetical protein PKU91_01735 [Phycisphaerales bacterium]|nr:hypothetical protein [Phycisphaerales bacterium]
MSDRYPRLDIGLDQSEGRARHLDRRIGKGADEGAGERRLAGAKIAMEQDRRAGACNERKLGAKGFRRFRPVEESRQGRHRYRV